jgi:hypothetical protein
MRAFRIAFFIFIFLICGVLILSLAGKERIGEYRNATPTEEAELTEAAETLSALSARMEDERLLLALLFSHERCDTLKTAVARCAAAARADEYPEYVILRAELLGLYEAMERDLRPGILDIL